MSLSYRPFSLSSPPSTLSKKQWKKYSRVKIKKETATSNYVFRGLQPPSASLPSPLCPLPAGCNCPVPTKSLVGPGKGSEKQWPRPPRRGVVSFGAGASASAPSACPSAVLGPCYSRVPRAQAFSLSLGLFHIALNSSGPWVLRYPLFTAITF